MVMREREVKLAVDETFRLPSFDDAVPGAVVDEPEERQIVDVYYDTVDLRLLRWGCTLRNRKGKGWMVKLPVQATGQATVRDEVSFRGRAGKPPPAALELVDSFTRGEPVAVVARFATRRLACQWRSGTELLLELVDDRVTVELATGGSSSFRQLEVELAPDADTSLADGVVQRLVEAGAEPDPGGIKLAVALGERADNPPDVVVPSVGRKSTAREIIRSALARSVAELLVELPAARLGQNPEGIHKARVATRRLRSDLRTFKPFLDQTWSARLDTGLRSLGAALGLVRDCDVLIDRFLTELGASPTIDGDAGRRIIDLLAQQRDDAREKLALQLADPMTHRVLDDLVAAAADPSTLSRADRRGQRQLRASVRKRWSRLERAVNALEPEPSTAALHDVRILAKRTRYAAEAVAPAFGSDATVLAKAMAGIQSVLGGLHDDAVAARWLAGAVDQLGPEAAFVAGRLTERLIADGQRHRHGWEKAYRKAGRKRTRAWLA